MHRQDATEKHASGKMQAYQPRQFEVLGSTSLEIRTLQAWAGNATQITPAHHC
jgi:hypothetical protein